MPAPANFLRLLRALCDRNGILLIADEIQCGYGRTGTMWCFEHAGVIPDIVCIAKSIANGLPLAAIVSSRELQERWGLGAHGTTFGGNPVSCAAGIAVLETIQGEGLVANAAARGEQLAAGVRRLTATDKRVGDIRGLGLMLGVEFVRDQKTKEPRRRNGQRRHRALRRRGPARAHLRRRAQRRPLGPAAERDR